MDPFTRSFKCFFCFCTMNTEGDVIPEAGPASVPLCQVPHYIYLSAIIQTQAYLAQNCLCPASKISFFRQHTMNYEFVFLS